MNTTGPMDWSEKPPPRSLSVALGVRPIRLAIGVPNIPGVSWVQAFEAAIASQTRVWGGVSNLPFLLTRDWADRELFWALADRLDADAWAIYMPTVADMEQLDPAWLRADRAAVLERLVSATEEERASFLRDHGQTPIAEPAEIAESQWQEIANRVAPFEHGSHGGRLELVTAGAPSWPLVDVSALADLPGRVRNVATTSSPVLRLLLTTELGRINSAFAGALSEHGTHVTNESRTSAAATLSEIFSSRDLEGQRLPWTLSEHGLAHYQYGGFRRPPVTVVVGDSPWDFTLFYALRRWTSLSFWLPSWQRRNDLYLDFMLRAVRRWALRGSGQILVVTTSKTTRFRDETARLIRDQAQLRPRQRVDTAAWEEVLPEEPNRLYERGNFGLPRQSVPLDNGTTTELPTPLPRKVRCRDYMDMHWITEAAVSGWSPLRHPAVAETVLAPGESSEQRATRRGVAYMCPASFVPAGAELETIAIRPRLRPMSLLEQLNLIIKPEGWRSRPSDKGIYAAETSALFGGRVELTRALRDPNIRPLLSAYLGSKGIEVSGGRRYLSTRHAEELLGEDRAHAVIDELVAGDVLTRGLVLRCARCRQTAWYSLDDLGRSFRCARCRLEQPVERQWIGGEEPAWFYELAEVVYQFLRNNGHLPLLAAEAHFGSDGGDIDRVFELEFIPPGENATGLEVDIVAKQGHRLWLGETARDLKATRKWVSARKSLARRLHAHGFLFATTQTKFSRAAEEKIRSGFAGKPVELALLTEIPDA